MTNETLDDNQVSDIHVAAGPRSGPTVADILAAHADGRATPTSTAMRVADAIESRGDDGTWITPLSRAELLEAARALESRPDARDLPLYGVPFGVKDSIDVSGQPTTLACPEYAYVASETAPVVTALLEAGALYVGKTNLDQFATGLNGTRTPYTIPRSVFGNEIISGGSSSGSALAVALGEVPFCVATDTAGSGRVPAALNGIVGWKPSRGLISTVGLVPACKSLDCITLMATTVDDLDRVFDVVAGVDDRDAWSRERGARYDGHPITIGFPDPGDLAFFGDDAMATAHFQARDRLLELGFGSVTVPFAPFETAGELLYQGPWVAERLVEFADFLDEKPDAFVPVVREIFEGGRGYSAVDAFRAQQRLQECKALVARLWNEMDVMVLPTIGTTFTVEEVQSKPIGCNSMLGHYTHFGNLLDLTAVAVPAGSTADGRPVSLMVVGPALADDVVLDVAARILGQSRSAPAVSHPPAAVDRSAVARIDAVPTPFAMPAGKTALLVIDMQRDFLLEGGFGDSLGNDVSRLATVVEPLAALIAGARAAGVPVIHTREGHRPDLSDCPPAKLNRGAPSSRIGDQGKYGRILIQGEYGHDIVDELAPVAGEIVIDKPGKGAFYATELEEILQKDSITTLLVTGVTTEVCVHTTTREANDRGYECLVVSDCVGSYFPEFQRVGLEMISAQGGIFGWVADSAAVLSALSALAPTP
jgi:allophanate hydrolase